MRAGGGFLFLQYNSFIYRFPAACFKVIKQSVTSTKTLFIDTLGKTANFKKSCLSLAIGDAHYHGVLAYNYSRYTSTAIKQSGKSCFLKRHNAQPYCYYYISFYIFLNTNGSTIIGYAVVASQPCMFFFLSDICYYKVRRSLIKYNTIQYNTIQYNTIQYNTIQYNKIE